MMKPTSKYVRSVGHRSGFETRIAQELQDKGVNAPYEPFALNYSVPATPHKYTPDFVLPNGIVIETKGYFLTEDRMKHLHIAKEHPSLDIRFVFQNPTNPIRKGSPTSYAAWCTKNGFQYAAKSIPQSWLDEPPLPKRLAALEVAQCVKQ